MDDGATDSVVEQAGQEYMGMTNDLNKLVRQPRSKTPMVVSIIAGTVVFLLLLGVGYLVSRNATSGWVARASALVLPSKLADPEQLPGYYETLSRGQIVTTLAELVRLGEFQAEVADRLGLSDAQREFVSISVHVVTGTAMLQVVASSEDPKLAVAMVDGVVDVSTVYIGDLLLPYSLVPVSGGSNNLVESGQSPSTMFGIFAVVALVAGLAVQQATLHLMRVNRRPTDTPPSDGEPGTAIH